MKELSANQQRILDLMSKDSLTERQLKILFALARFKFLTMQQLSYIFGINTTSTLSVLLKKMSKGKYPLIDAKDFGVIPVHGKLPRVHFLTKYGVLYIESLPFYDDSAIKFPRNKNGLFQRDYFHRRATIDFHIRFSEWLIESGGAYGFFNYDFDQKGTNRNGNLELLNSIQLSDRRIVPDGIGMFHKDDKPYLFLFEQHNGKDSQRAVDQIKNHCQAISEGASSDKFDMQVGTRVYYSFEQSGCMNAVIERLKNDSEFTPFDKYFYFKTFDDMSNNFADNWLHIHIEPTDFI